MEDDVFDALLAARTLISDPADWAQGWIARTATGSPTRETSRGAAKWCAVGALGASGAPRDIAQAAHYCLIGSAIALFRSAMPADVNDQRSHADVLRMYDHALKARFRAWRAYASR